jgi:hypothetical protein
MTFDLIIKAIIVVVFLVIFLRRPTVVWGVGLLTVTSAVLLDTFLGTFGREEMIADFGFFFYIIAGALFSGGAIWAWGLLRPLTSEAPAAIRLAPAGSHRIQESDPSSEEATASTVADSGTAIDRQMLYDEIRLRLGREDILDLIFDLGLNENDVITLNQDMNQLIVNLMDVAIQRDLESELALAVERILTPVPPEHLPRLDRIDAESPPTILRHYLLANYTMKQLRQLASDLDVDWEQLAAGSKKEKARSLLLYLYRRNRIEELIELMQE